MDDCLFCKIAAGEIPFGKVYEDDDVLAFRDISPMAPVHVLVIPKQHVASVLEAGNLPAGMCEKLMRVCGEVAKREGIADSGFRIVSNCGEDGCQSVKHWHIHVLGGKKLPDQLG